MWHWREDRMPTKHKSPKYRYIHLCVKNKLAVSSLLWKYSKSSIVILVIAIKESKLWRRMKMTLTTAKCIITKVGTAACVYGAGNGIVASEHHRILSCRKLSIKTLLRHWSPFALSQHHSSIITFHFYNVSIIWSIQSQLLFIKHI